MKYIVIDRPGGYNQLKLKEAADLHPASGQIIVNVKAAGISYAESIVRMGLYQSAKKHGYPITPGFEFSGTVGELGDGVTEFKVSQNVFGVNFFDCYASQVRVPVGQLFAIPPGLSMSQAASFAVSYLTAWYAVFKMGQATPGMIVLVHSAAGGVGIALTQVLKMLGCTVIGVVGASAKVEISRQAGCAQVIDKSTEPLWATAAKHAPNGFDLIFDSTGVDTLKEGYRLLRPTGRLISYGFGAMLPKTGYLNFISLAWNYFKSPRFNPIHMADENKSVMAFNLSFLFDRQDLLTEGMQTILTWLKEGKIRSLPVKEYPFTEVAQAQRDIESGCTVGKLALTF